MDVQTLTGPGSEPLSLASAKAYLRVDPSDEDALIAEQIAEARQQVEDFCRLRLITQTVRLTLDAFPARIRIPVWPVQSITQIEYDDADGVAQVLPAADYTLIQSRKPWEIGPAFAAVWPSTRAHWNAVRVDIAAGFGEAADVPADLVAALKLILGALWWNREELLVGVTGAPLPALTGARAKMMPHVFYV